MSSAETITRQWDILQRIPRSPRSITVRELSEQLPTTDYHVSVRTLQRDLIGLSHKFPLISEEKGRTQHWCWMKNAEQVLLPHMTGSMAATLLLARDYLKPVLPAAVLNELNTFFEHASEVLTVPR